MYSADMIHSSNVALNPLFNKIGFFVPAPTFFNKSKFCMFLAPICIKSTFSLNSSRYWASINSEQIGSPVAFLAATKISNPEEPIPWNAYGEVLGLKAPPLKIFAPAFLAALAISITCSSLSTEQGPAIKARLSPPTLTPATSTIVSSG